MKLSMEYKTTEKFVKTLENKGNPYSEDTRPWHIFIDICTSQPVNKPTTLDIDHMMAHHNLEWEYYVDSIGELVEDGYLEIIYDKGEGK